MDLSTRPLAALFAQGITDEFIHTLTQADGLRVISKAYLSQFTSTSWDIPSLAEKLGVQSIVEGTVSEKDGWLEITIRIVRTNGFQTSSRRFQAQINTETMFKVQKQVATAFVSRSQPQQSRIRRWKAPAGALTVHVYPLVLPADALLDEGSSSDLQAALVKFNDATVIAPGFARSFCGISQ